jgi:2-polyprenyl-3-methyl-5-hydroxy-6-metoxy-1,4-benzoquinol methylase
VTAPIRTTSAPQCRRCGADGRVLHERLHDRILHAPGEWALRTCDRCRLAWLDPQPQVDDLARLYDGEYMTHAASPADAHVGAVTRRYLAAAYGYGGPPVGAGRRSAVTAIDDALGGQVCWLPFRPGGTLLDVGCGSGAFLARMRALGWQVAGVEPDPAAAAVARDVHGLDVEVDITPSGTRPFDAITMHHVIEHLPDPFATVAALARRLSEGGRLVVVTPNIESVGRRRFGARWVHWDPPRHLWLFSLTALQEVATAAGLKVERAWSTGRFARFVGTASAQIATTGRVRPGGPSLAERVSGAAFQARETVAAFTDAQAGEELVVVAVRREAGAPR